MSRSVFISHAVADKPLVEAFVRFLEDGIGLPEAEIFCVSIPGMGIPTGTSFVNYIRDEMTRPALVIMLITPNYLASAFCQGEMGAAWIKGHRIFPLIVPPSTFADMGGVFLGTQAIKIDDDVRVNELKDALVSTVRFTPKSTSRWDLARKDFYGKLPALIQSLPPAQTVSRQAHEELQAKYEDALGEMSDQEEQIRRLRDQITALENAKNAEEVAEIAAAFSDTEAGEQLLALLKDAKAAIASLGPTVLRMHVLAKYHSKPFEGWRDDPEVFDAAVRRNLLTEELDLRWNAAQIKRVTNALETIDAFVRLNSDELEGFAEREFDAPLETDNEDFWREHLL